MAQRSSVTPGIGREHVVVGIGLALVTALAWAYTVHLAWRMEAMGAAMAAPQWQPWNAVDFALMLVMWVVMMAAMMLPAAAPVILLFATVSRTRREQGGPYVPTAVFASGYVAVWAGFSVAATLAQWGLHATAVLSPLMVTISPLLGGALLAAAGAFQLTRLKHACLARCRSPLGFLLTEWRESPRGALVMGVRHGAYCVGCCWALMALLFFGGVMNLLWVAGLALVVLGEKVLPRGEALSKAGGIALVAWGGWVVLAALG